MHAYVSVDLEGVAGAFEGGATAVLVNDSHGDMRNLPPDELDPRAELVSGTLKRFSMVEGIDGRFGVALFVGYHAGAQTAAAVLDHTYNGRVVIRLRVNGEEWDEAALNAALCGSLGVPVGLVAEDSAACRAAQARFGAIETVEVKQGLSRYAARSVHPKVSCERIQAASKRAVERARAGELKPYRPAPPSARGSCWRTERPSKKS